MFKYAYRFPNRVLPLGFTVSDMNDVLYVCVFMWVLYLKQLRVFNTIQVSRTKISGFKKVCLYLRKLLSLCEQGWRKSYFINFVQIDFPIFILCRNSDVQKVFLFLNCVWGFPEGQILNFGF